jgi:hypothetical protein
VKASASNGGRDTTGEEPLRGLVLKVFLLLRRAVHNRVGYFLSYWDYVWFGVEKGGYPLPYCFAQSLRFM